MSSITKDGRDRGQVLVIFALGLVAFVAIAALVFDVGQSIFERRNEQDASDASALAGARWLTEPACKANPSAANCAAAVDAAYKIAALHGYTGAKVQVFVPPSSSSQFAGFPGHIQVIINTQRPSLFAGALGMTSFRITSQAVASNINDYSFPYSFMALSQTCPKTGHLSGNGTFNIGASVFAAADCDGSPGSLVFDGNRTIANVTGTCASPGSVSVGPSATVTCGSYQNNAPLISDPLSGLQAPAIGTSVVPDPPHVPVILAGSLATNSKYNNCPGVGASSTTATTPKTCILDPQSGNPVVRLYPGVYYGGLQMKQTSAAQHLTVYLEPGIYYMAGGGFQISGDIDIFTVDPGGTTYGSAGTSGVMVFNSDDPVYRTACVGGTGVNPQCIANFDDQNDTNGVVKLRGYAGSVYKGLLLFQDRNASAQPAVKLTGNSNMVIEGSFYLPRAQFSYQGNGSTAAFSMQVICDTFDVGGNGNLSVSWTPDSALKVHGTGLVQ